MKNGASLCIKCGHDTVMIRDSRVNERNWRLRRRECMACKHRWSTYEVPVEVMSSVEDVLDILHTLGIHVQIIERLLEKARHAGIVGEGNDIRAYHHYHGYKDQDTDQRRHGEVTTSWRGEKLYYVAAEMRHVCINGCSS